MTGTNLSPGKLLWQVVEKWDLDGRRRNLSFFFTLRKKFFLERGKVKERSWTFSPHTALNVEVRNSTLSCVTYSCLWITQSKSLSTTQVNFSVTSLEKKTKGSFLKLFRKQGGKWGRNGTSLLLIWWTLNFPKHDSPRQDMEKSCTTHIWWNSYHPSHWPLRKENQDQSSLPYWGATSCLQNTKTPSLLVFLLPLLNSYSSRLRKTPLEIVNKPATHKNIKQKETWTIPPSLPGFITRCKVKTEEERKDTTEFILPDSFISFFFIPDPSWWTHSGSNNAIVNFSFFISIAGLFTISWIVPRWFLFTPSRLVSASHTHNEAQNTLSLSC